MTFPISSSASQLIANVVYGTIATVIGVVAIWQSSRAWKAWYNHRQEAMAECKPNTVLSVSALGMRFCSLIASGS